MLLVALGCGQPAVEQTEPATTHAAASEAEATPLPGARAKVILVPLRSFPDDLLVAVEQALETELAVEVEVHAPVELPEAAYYPPRKRYRADALLDFLDSYAADAGIDPSVKLLGLTEVDISTTSEPHEDWGIFGLGRSPGQSAVVSSKRLSRRPKNREHVRFRLATTSVHEIGHTFGLPHCQEEQAGCVMLDAEGGIENTDANTGKLGPSCAKKLEYLTLF
ncbi:hypothetical protein [Enhygromyxa salina]|nr:hypothetical protein [Enhygromyxa salina]